MYKMAPRSLIQVAGSPNRSEKMLCIPRRRSRGHAPTLDEACAHFQSGPDEAVWVIGQSESNQNQYKH